MNDKQREQAREQTRLRVQRYRDNKKSVTTDNNVTHEDVTQEVVPVSFVEGLNGKMYQTLPERSRYLTLSDGQVLDRLNQPNRSNSPEMRACNEARYNYHSNQVSKEALRELTKLLG